MYNKKSMASAIIAIVAAAIFIGLMIMLPFLQYNTGEGGDLGTAIGAIFVILISIIGYVFIYAGSLSFAIVAVVFGSLMLKQKSRNKLISYNKRMLIATCVLLPVLVVGFIISSALIFQSNLGLFPPAYLIIAAVAYIGCLVAQIVTIVLLKKMPEESISADTEESSSAVSE